MVNLLCCYLIGQTDYSQADSKYTTAKYGLSKEPLINNLPLTSDSSHSGNFEDGMINNMGGKSAA